MKPRGEALADSFAMAERAAQWAGHPLGDGGLNSGGQADIAEAGRESLVAVEAVGADVDGQYIEPPVEVVIEGRGGLAGSQGAETGGVRSLQKSTVTVVKIETVVLIAVGYQKVRVTVIVEVSPQGAVGIADIVHPGDRTDLAE